ncbi:MAG: hypothetical protein DYG83_04100 [Candidatus Brocadia sp. AMX2]|nr:MAG: hypothetical protein EDM70_03500 [Candidatus Brocadia sp. AMX2]MBC6931631.1 hypothetical protein [Candidatus Brocadia sp.]MBL1169004.1 hypothetical protein [Candidatus Brocadia sp. AMX1]MCE7866005.1 hypothetical protein [Candidatus Brocadia sp. AMX2]MCQ3916652.1 hypothetical protein [Candidatus Brocadia sp.]
MVVLYKNETTSWVFMRFVRFMCTKLDKTKQEFPIFMNKLQKYQKSSPTFPFKMSNLYKSLIVLLMFL